MVSLDAYIMRLDGEVEKARSLRWYGGKGKLVDILLKYIPKHTTYVEPFFGSGKLFFSKEKSKNEVINDLEDLVYSFWKVVQDEKTFNIFYKKLLSVFYSRKIFYEYKRMKPAGIIDKALKLFISSQMSVNGILTRSSFSISKDRNKTTSFFNGIYSLKDMHKRLQFAIIENLDAIEIIKRYDTPETFFYLDPPYVIETRCFSKDYTCEMTNEQHKELVNTIINSKGLFLVSAHKHEIYDRLLQYNFKTEQFALPSNTMYIPGFKHRNIRYETIYYNYDIGEF